jgi:membrane protein implicated in regulation of membrane protease activity
VLLIVLLIGLAVLYRYGPDRRAARWQWVTVGSLFAAVTWIIASFLFSWYLASFANYNATYGSLGAAVGVMIWLWISNTVMLLGAELNAEIEHQTARDSTVGAEKPLGARGAVMARYRGSQADLVCPRPTGGDLAVAFYRPPSRREFAINALRPSTNRERGALFALLRVLTKFFCSIAVLTKRLCSNADA